MKIDRSILPPGKIGLAVSGGADSVALAFLLTKGGTKRNAAKRFVVLHVDHGLRRESAEEYRFKDHENGMGFDSLVEFLDKPQMGAFFGTQTYFYIPKFVPARNLMPLIQNVADDIP